VQLLLFALHRLPDEHLYAVGPREDEFVQIAPAARPPRRFGGAVVQLIVERVTYDGEDLAVTFSPGGFRLLALETEGAAA
jgi:hypothetical protein